MASNINSEIIAQTENFIAWKADEPDGETTYHLDINNITVHFFIEEWEDFLSFSKGLLSVSFEGTGVIYEDENYYADCEKIENDQQLLYSLEVSGATIYLFEEDWNEFIDLLKQL